MTRDEYERLHKMISGRAGVIALQDLPAARARIAELETALREIYTFPYGAGDNWTWQDVSGKQTEIARKALENKP